MSERIRVLIAGLGGGSHGLEVMKSLRLSDIEYYICGADMSPHSMGLFKADKGYVIPRAVHEDYIPNILDICEKESIDVIIHGSESDLKVLSENRETFKERGIFLPLNTKEVIETCMNKKDTFIYLEKKGIRIPKTVAIASENDISQIDFFPCVIKPYKGTGGSRNTFIAQDKQELDFFCKYMMKYGSESLVQEYMGSYDSEFTVGILSDKNGDIISSVAIKRSILSGLSNRLYVKSLRNPHDILAISSGISQGEIINNTKILNQCKTIAKAIESKGPLNIQCRLVNDEVYPFEINPRFSGTTYLRALVGINEPDLLIRKYILKEKISYNLQPREGLILRGLEEMYIDK